MRLRLSLPLLREPDIKHPHLSEILLAVSKIHTQLLRLQRQGEVGTHDIRDDIIRVVL